MPDVGSEIISIISQKIGNGSDRLSPADPLDDLGINSFEVVELIFDLEEKFDIQIPYNANSVIEAKTIGDLIKVIEELVKAKATSA
jgi:acyl carrier protein